MAERIWYGVIADSGTDSWLIEKGSLQKLAETKVRILKLQPISGEFWMRCLESEGKPMKSQDKY
jgi:hypothetical protein